MKKDIQKHLAELHKIKYLSSFSDDELTEMALRKFLNKHQQESLYLVYRKELRRKLLVEQKYKCFYCQDPIKYETSSLDHKTPKYRGGSGEVENLVACCLPCNSEKGTMTAEEYFDLISRDASSPTH